MVRSLARLYSALSKTAGLCLLLLAVMVTVDVIVRATTGKPFTGVFELSRILLLMSFALAIGGVDFFDKHLRVDILSGNFSGPARQLSSILDRVLTVIVFGMIIWVGWKEWLHAYASGFLQPGIIQIPTTIPLGFLVGGAVMVVLAVIARTVLPVEDVTDPQRIKDRPT